MPGLQFSPKFEPGPVRNEIPDSREEPLGTDAPAFPKCRVRGNSSAPSGGNESATASPASVRASLRNGYWRTQRGLLDFWVPALKGGPCQLLWPTSQEILSVRARRAHASAPSPNHKSSGFGDARLHALRRTGPCARGTHSPTYRACPRRGKNTLLARCHKASATPAQRLRNARNSARETITVKCEFVKASCGLCLCRTVSKCVVIRRKLCRTYGCEMPALRILCRIDVESASELRRS